MPLMPTQMLHGAHSKQTSRGATASGQAMDGGSGVIMDLGIIDIRKAGSARLLAAGGGHKSLLRRAAVYF